MRRESSDKFYVLAPDRKFLVLDRSRIDNLANRMSNEEFMDYLTGDRGRNLPKAMRYGEKLIVLRGRHEVYSAAKRGIMVPYIFINGFDGDPNLGLYPVKELRTIPSEEYRRVFPNRFSFDRLLERKLYE